MAKPEDTTREEGSDFDDWPIEKQKDFFDVLALGAQRYGGGNGKNICQVTPCDHQ